MKECVQHSSHLDQDMTWLTINRRSGGETRGVFSQEWNSETRPGMSKRGEGRT